MPSLMPSGQPARSADWFGSEAGAVLLACQAPHIAAARQARPGMPMLWLNTDPTAALLETGDVVAAPCGARWCGTLVFADAFPLASESLALVVVQHALDAHRDGVEDVLAECSRVLLPGGQLLLFTLNPLSPYRWRWRGQGLKAREPVQWRRQLKAVGLQPDPVSRGIGPIWHSAAAIDSDGAGMAASYLIRAEKRRGMVATVARGQRVVAEVPSA